MHNLRGLKAVIHEARVAARRQRHAHEADRPLLSERADTPAKGGQLSASPQLRTGIGAFAIARAGE